MKLSPHLKSPVALGLALVLLAGMGLRAAYGPELVSSAPFILPTTDASYHQHWARGLAFGDWQPPADASADPHIPDQPFFRPPGYPYFLAAIYRLFGANPYVPVVSNMLLDLGGAVLLFFLARRIFGNGPALISAMLAATYWGFVYYEGMMLEPPLLFFLMAATLLACSPWARHVGWAHSLAAGFAMGLGVWVRPNLLVCIPVCLGWGLWQIGLRRAGWRPAGRLLAAVLGALMVTLAPALWRNYRVSGEWPVLTTNGGINLYIANNPETDCMTSTLPREFKAMAGLAGTEWTSFDYPHLVDTLSKATRQELTAVGADRYFRQWGWQYIRTHRLQTAKNVGTRFLLFWGPHEIANNLVAHMDRQQSRILRWGLDFSAVLALALLGLIFFVRQGWVPPAAPPPSDRSPEQIGLLVVLFIAAYSASYLPFFIAARYRLAVVPFLLVFAGKGVGDLIAMVRTRQYALATCVAAFLLAGYGVLAKPVIPPPLELHLWYGQQARALSQTQHYSEAAEMYRKAIDLAPGNTVLHNNLGIALLEMRDFEGARLAFQRAVMRGPQIAQPHANLALVNFKLLRLEEAEIHYRIAVQLRPERADWWLERGRILAIRSNPEAGNCFRKALELDPNNPQARQMLRVWEQGQSPKE